MVEPENENPQEQSNTPNDQQQPQDNGNVANPDSNPPAEEAPAPAVEEEQPNQEPPVQEPNGDANVNPGATEPAQKDPEENEPAANQEPNGEPAADPAKNDPENPAPYSDEYQDNPTLGVGVDTNGDGNADTPPVVTPDLEDDAEPVHVDHEDDYIGKVRLSENMGDFMAKQTATKLVNASQISEYYKNIIRSQIISGQLQPPYGDVIKRLKSASDAGSIYRPGADGL